MYGIENRKIKEKLKKKKSIRFYASPLSRPEIYQTILIRGNLNLIELRLLSYSTPSRIGGNYKTHIREEIMNKTFCVFFLIDGAVITGLLQSKSV